MQVKKTCRIYTLIFLLFLPTLVSAQYMEDAGPNNLEYIHEGVTNKFPVVVIDSGIDYTHPNLASLLHKNTETKEIQIGPYKVEGDVFGWDFNENDAFSYDNEYSYKPEFTAVPNYNSAQDFESNFSSIAKSLLKNFVEAIVATISMGSPGHGTHVSGIVLEHCHSCSIVPLKVFGKETLSIQSLSAAIEYAHQRKYKLVNMSLGVNTKYFNNNLEEQGYLAEVIEKIQLYDDILFVVAAGNDGAYLSELIHPVYPAMLDLPNVITVGATDQDGNLAEFSNYDPSFVDVFSPGVEIRSTWINGEYKKVSGTSMSSPMIAGRLGSLWSKNNDMTPAEIKSLFLSQTSRTSITYKDFKPLSVPFVNLQK